MEDKEKEEEECSLASCNAITLESTKSFLINYRPHQRTYYCPAYKSLHRPCPSLPPPLGHCTTSTPHAITFLPAFRSPVKSLLVTCLAGVRVLSTGERIYT